MRMQRPSGGRTVASAASMARGNPGLLGGEHGSLQRHLCKGVAGGSRFLKELKFNLILLLTPFLV